MTRDGDERRSGRERRAPEEDGDSGSGGNSGSGVRSVLADPRYLLSLLAFIVGTGGGVMGAWITMQTKTTRMESAASQLQDTAREIKSTVATIQSSVQALSNDQTQLRAQTSTELSAQRRDIDHLQQQVDVVTIQINNIKEQNAGIVGRLTRSKQQ